MWRRSGRIALSFVLALLGATGSAGAQTNRPARTSPATSGKTPSLPRSLEDLAPEVRKAVREAPAPTDLPNANAACLLATGRLTIQSEGTLVALYHRTIKLFNARARPLAEVNLSYEDGRQSVSVLYARTISPTGAIRSVRPSEIRTGARLADYPLYQGSRSLGFSLPGIEDGCVIDYAWQVITRPTLPGTFWTTWSFSALDAEPTLLSRFSLTTPITRPFQSRITGVEGLAPTVLPTSDGRALTYVWEHREAIPAKEAPTAPPAEGDQRPEITSLTSWQECAAWYGRQFQNEKRVDNALYDTLDTLTQNRETQAEKAQAIYDWVTDQVRSVGLEFGRSGYRPHNAAEIHAKRYGDGQDKTTLLITLLNLARIRAYPALLAIGSQSLIRYRLPSLDAFDHCIAVAEIDGQEIWLDTSTDTCSYGDIPIEDRGCDALVIRDGKGDFETIPRYSPLENGADIQVKVAMQPDGGATIHMEVALHGAKAQILRGALRSLSADQRKQLAYEIVQAFAPGSSVESYTLPDGQARTDPFSLQFDLTAPKWARIAGTRMLFPLSLTQFGDAPLASLPDLQGRAWMVPQGSEDHEDVVITLPAGYRVEDLPEDLELRAGLFTYHRRLLQSVDRRTLTCTQIEIRQAGQIAPADYAKLQNYQEERRKHEQDEVALSRAPAARSRGGAR
ncbi:MAG TPA: DUF3857 domain-containing protein [Chthonomonadaceae bacterium]|nr:DUF3857 domain-containing protein [Chthonomonadaceae bacterium]